MNPAHRAQLAARIAEVAGHALSTRQVVTPIEVLAGIGWLPAAQIESWRRGRVPYLERVAGANLATVNTALRLLAGWAPAARPDPERDGLRDLDLRSPPAALHQDGRHPRRTCLANPLDLPSTDRRQYAPDASGSTRPHRNSPCHIPRTPHSAISRAAPTGSDSPSPGQHGDTCRTAGSQRAMRGRSARFRHQAVMHDHALRRPVVATTVALGRAVESDGRRT
jgi:hypothetical protein